jgi:Xaa-Pro aminopeptidase
MAVVGLTEAGCRARRETLFERLPTDVSHMLVVSPLGLAYFAAFTASPFVFRSQRAGAALVLARDGGAWLFADNLQEPFVHKAFAVEWIGPLWYRCVEEAPDRAAFLADQVRGWLSKTGVAHLAVERSHTPLAMLPDGVRIAMDIGPVLHELRRTKHADEVAQIVESLRVATAGLNAARNDVRPGWTERDLFDHVSRHINLAAGESTELYGDFVCGAGCEVGGGPPAGRIVRPGDAVLLDFSAITRGYRGDFASTFVCGGEPSDQQRDMERACLEALAETEPMLRPGASCAGIHAAVCRVFASRGWGDCFPHHTGHGLGLGHPDAPYLIPQSAESLQAGDVVTLEPGLYKAGVGGMRFEHTYVITADGARRLTTHHIGLV